MFFWLSTQEAKEKEFHLRKSLELHDEYTAAYINLGFVLAVNNRCDNSEIDQRIILLTPARPPIPIP